jgi:hypothetical protein
LKSFRDYLIGLSNPQADFNPPRLLEIMDSFSEPLYSHLKAEPQALLALSRFSSPERQFDLTKIALEAGKKSVTFEFALNVLPIFLLNHESVEFEGGMWQNHPAVPSFVRWVMKNVLPLWQRQWWRFMSCTSDGRRKHMVA